MPYAKNEDLPDDVKNALPAEAQSIFRNAFNSAEKDGDEEKAMRVAWGAVKNAGWMKDGDKWVKKNSTVDATGVEIFRVGTWNGDPYTTDDLDAMVFSFGDLLDEHQPPLKLGHNKAQEKEIFRDGQPALGWVSRLYRSGDRLLADFKDVPEKLAEAIKAKLYKNVSAEIYFNLRHGGKVFKRVLRAVALLGADIPAVSGLKDLDNFFSQSTVDAGSFEKVGCYSFDHESGNITKQKSGGSEMSDELKIYKDKIAALESDLADAKKEGSKVVVLEADLKKHKQELADLRKAEIDRDKDAAWAEVKTFCADMVKAGKMSPAAMKVICGTKEKPGVHAYSEDAKAFSFGFETLKEFMSLQGELLDKGVKGDNEGDRQFSDVQDEIDALVKTYREKNTGASYSVAFSAIMADKANAELAEKYLDASGGNE